MSNLESAGSVPFVRGVTLFHGIKKDRHIAAAIKTAVDTLRLLNMPGQVGLRTPVGSGTTGSAR